MTSDDAREELARLIASQGQVKRPALYDYRLAEVLLAAGYERRTPAGEAERADAIDQCVMAIGPGVSGSEPREALEHLFDAALSTRPAGESAGVAEALEAELRQSAECARRAQARLSKADADLYNMRRLAFTEAADLVRDRLAARASRAPAADASGVVG